MSIPQDSQSYVGSELELFASATNWKKYLRRQITPYLGTRVLEVGAGLGATTQTLCRDQERWVCLEPDRSLADRIRQKLQNGDLPRCCEVVDGTLPERIGGRFDTVLYIDVLEHIKDDRQEIERAAQVLTPGGHLIVLAPAHQSLFTAFDRSIGHYRRYTRRTLSALSPPDLQNATTSYLDSVGLLASVGNRFVLRSAMPRQRHIHVWDRMMVPLSGVLDPLFAYRLGKSVLTVWRKQGSPALARGA